MTAHNNSRTQRALDRVLAGAKVADAANAEGIRLPNVYRALAKYRATGVRPLYLGPAPKPREPKPRVVRGSAAMHRALDLLRGGATLIAASKAEGVDVSGLYRAARREGVPTGRRGHPMGAKMQRAIVDALAGKPIRIAAHINGVRADQLRSHVDRVMSAAR